MTKHPTWEGVRDEVQLALWREQLEKTRGNVTRAGRALGYSKRQSTTLVYRLGLGEFARALRVKNTGRDKGRPPAEEK